MQAAVFSALGEPNRLRMVDLLGGGPTSVGEVATALGLRQPQASKHLKVLVGAGLVHLEPRSRQRICHLQAEPFDDIAQWITSFEQLWDARLDSLGRYLATRTEEHPT